MAVHVFALARFNPNGLPLVPSPVRVLLVLTPTIPVSDAAVRVSNAPAFDIVNTVEVLPLGKPVPVIVVNRPVLAVLAPTGLPSTVPPLIVKSSLTCVFVNPFPIRTALIVVLPLFVLAISAFP